MDLGDRNKRGNELWDVLRNIYASLEEDYKNIPKLIGMQEAYLLHNPNFYGESETTTIRKKLEAVIDKLQMSTFWLEQMWALSDASRGHSFVTGKTIQLNQPISSPIKRRSGQVGERECR